MEEEATQEPAARKAARKEAAARTRAALKEEAADERSRAKLAAEEARVQRLADKQARRSESEARAALKVEAAADRQARAEHVAERERRTAAELARVKAELAELRQSYYLSGAAKKLDLREVEGFGEIAADVVSAGRTNMNYDRLYTLWQAVRVAPQGKPVVEVGTCRGGSARLISETFKGEGRSPRFYVCDTFAGHPRTDSTFDTVHHGAGKFANASAAETAEYLSGYRNLEILEGDIVETGAQLADESFGFVHVDVDVYPATDFCLRFFAPRLAQAALLVIDDYGFLTCPGAKRAADQFIAEFPDFRLIHLLSGQAIVFRAH